MSSILLFFCKQKTAYEVRISDWSSDVCSSDLTPTTRANHLCVRRTSNGQRIAMTIASECRPEADIEAAPKKVIGHRVGVRIGKALDVRRLAVEEIVDTDLRAEESRGWKEWVSTCRSRWGADNERKKTQE